MRKFLSALMFVIAALVTVPAKAVARTTYQPIAVSSQPCFMYVRTERSNLVSVNISMVQSVEKTGDVLVLRMANQDEYYTQYRYNDNSVKWLQSQIDAALTACRSRE